jgi:hypothetical protein
MDLVARMDPVYYSHWREDFAHVLLMPYFVNSAVDIRRHLQC